MASARRARRGSAAPGARRAGSATGQAGVGWANDGSPGAVPAGLRSALRARALPAPLRPRWGRSRRRAARGRARSRRPRCVQGAPQKTAATRAGAHHAAAREALLRYVLRPPIAQERIELQQDGLVRLSLKRAFADGTVAASMDPLSLLCRLAASVPPPRFHTVKYAGVLASARPWRKRIGPRPAKPEELAKTDHEPAPKRKRGGYRPWAELLRRTCAIDVLECPTCKGRMKLVAMVTEPRNIARFLSALGEPTDVPARSPNRGPPYWKSTVLRRKAPGDAA
ncbi:transposase [Sorangium sp. So ce1128]